MPDTKPNLYLTQLDIETLLSAVEQCAYDMEKGRIWQNEPPAMTAALKRVKKKLRAVDNPYARGGSLSQYAYNCAKIEKEE